RRGIRGNSAKKNKSKTTRIFRRARRLFLEHAATSWSNELQSLASSPGNLGREILCRPRPSLSEKQRSHCAPRLADQHVVSAACGAGVHHFTADAAFQDGSEQPR